MDECVYLTADPGSVLEAKKSQDAAGKTSNDGVEHEADEVPTKASVLTEAQNRHKRHLDLISDRTQTLIAISDYNCGNFLAKAFAFKTGTDFGSSFASTMLSSASSVLGLAGGVPALVPSAISAGSAAITGTTAAFDANFFAKQSFNIMEGGILAQRQLLRAQMNARICQGYKDLGLLPPAENQVCSIPPRTPYPGYTPTRYWTMPEALSDVMEYDRVCSFEGGLGILNSATAQQKTQAEAASGQPSTAAPAPQAPVSK
jgi:hypothetical protein